MVGICGSPKAIRANPSIDGDGVSEDFAAHSAAVFHFDLQRGRERLALKMAQESLCAEDAGRICPRCSNESLAAREVANPIIPTIGVGHLEVYDLR